MKKLVYTLTAIAALLSSCVKSADEQIVVEKSTTVAVEVAPAEGGDAQAQNGKVITKVTLTAPVGYLVDLKWKEYDGFTSGTYSDSWSGECKSRIVFTAAGSSHSNIESITVEYK